MGYLWVSERWIKYLFLGLGVRFERIFELIEQLIARLGRFVMGVH
jgi:hypothetical protein